ncbi:glycosyltransferase family 4 protein [Desulfococcaceae bacterium HSG7]|nr:glycosyltransferase family 4 protein [Desulfococcaceae bacterium HSG7]
MKKVLIIQNKILHYRKPVYNALANFYDVTILHSGKESVDMYDRYREIIVPVKKIGFIYWQSDVLKIIKSEMYDVIIAMFDLHWVNNLLAVFLEPRKRFIYWGHRYNQKIGNKLKDLLMRVSDGVILYSDTEIKKMVSRGISNSKIFVAPNTIYIPNSSDGSKKYKDSFLFTGRAQKRKKINQLIKAFSEIFDRIPENIKINIVGTGDENDNLKNMADQLGISDRVVFHGEILDNDKLMSLFHRAYAYISPGHVGLGALHSFAYGVPVVTDKNVRHAQEYDNLKHLENSLLFKTYNELKEILVTLCNDKHITARLGKNAYALYSEDRTLKKMVQGFRDAVDK